jgi:fibronectin type 3 domain-containing protein
LAVTGVTATQIGLSWNDIYTDEDGFRLERSTDSINFGEVVSLPANTTSFVDGNLLPNTFYAYRVLGFNGGGDSYYSMTVNATTLPLPPFTPSDLSATAVSQTAIQLIWTDTANSETSFGIERSSDGTTFVEIGVVPANTTQFADSSLSPNGTYYYRVRASNAGGSSPYSNTTSARTPDYPPAAPSNLTATAGSTSTINLSWTDHSNNEIGFQIERSSDGVNFSSIATVGAGVTAYSNTGLTPSTTYSYRVRAANLGGSSDYSNVAGATTLAATPPATPSNLTLTVVSSSQINLSWQDNASNETQFFVEMAAGTGAFTQIAQLSVNAHSYSATGLNRNTRYTFRVRCSNSGGYSGYSNAPNAKTLK